jgi:hypothetical protein
LQTAALAIPAQAAAPAQSEKDVTATATADAVREAIGLLNGDKQFPAATKTITIPKAHPILITVEGQVGSKISKAKDFFPIKLAQAVVIDGVEVLPAGIEGEGQVVHAAKGGFGGSAGELILAARYLEHNGVKIPLRSFKFLEEDDEFFHRGRDNTAGAMAAAAVAFPVGLLIGGGNTTIQPGTAAKAKIKQEMSFDLPLKGHHRALAVEEPTLNAEIDQNGGNE